MARCCYCHAEGDSAAHAKLEKERRDGIDKVEDLMAEGRRQQEVIEALRAEVERLKADSINMRDQCFEQCAALRAENETWNNLAQHNREASDHLEAENERLREALRAIDEANFDGDDVAVQNIARAALQSSVTLGSGNVFFDIGFTQEDYAAKCAENERLTAENAKLIATNGKWYPREKYDALRAENERLTLELSASLACNAANNKLFMAENERLREANVKFSNQCAIHDAEVNRLRGALEKIAEQSRVEKSHDWIAQTARAALQDGPGTATYNQRWKSKP